MAIAIEIPSNVQQPPTQKMGWKYIKVFWSWQLTEIKSLPVQLDLNGNNIQNGKYKIIAVSNLQAREVWFSTRKCKIPTQLK